MTLQDPEERAGFRNGGKWCGEGQFNKLNSPWPPLSPSLSHVPFSPSETRASSCKASSPLLSHKVTQQHSMGVFWFNPLQTPNCRRLLGLAQPLICPGWLLAGDEGGGVAGFSSLPGPGFSESTVAAGPSWWASFTSWLLWKESSKGRNVMA